MEIYPKPPSITPAYSPDLPEPSLADQFGTLAVFINPKAYGCKGDGTTKDTTNFQSALNTLAPGGTVYLPSNSRFLVDALSIPVSCKFEGKGTILYDFTNAPTGTPCITVNADDVTIKDVIFDAYGTVGTFDYKAYIYSTKKNTIVENCRFKNGMQGTHFAAGCQYSKVSNCKADIMLGSGFLILGASDNSVIGNTAISCGDGAISLFNAFRSSIIGNEVYTSDQGITIDAGSRSNTISGNRIYGDISGTTSASGYYGIDLKNNSHDNTIIGNTVYGCTVGIAARYGDAGNQATCANNVIKGNTITELSNKGIAGATTYGILIEAQYGLVVEGNSISRCQGIYIQGQTAGTYNNDLIISGNLLNLHGVNFGTLPYLAIDKTAINITGYNGVIIEHNLIQNPPETQTSTNVILNNCVSTQLSYNTVKNTTSTAVAIQGSTDAICLGNQFVTNSTSASIFNLSTTGNIMIKHNNQGGNVGGYFIIGNSTPYYAEGNVFYSTYSDAMNGTGNIRLFNNENKSTGLSGRQIRNNGDLIQVMLASGTWQDVGAQT